MYISPFIGTSIYPYIYIYTLEECKRQSAGLHRCRERKDRREEDASRGGVNEKKEDIALRCVLFRASGFTTDMAKVRDDYILRFSFY